MWQRYRHQVEIFVLALLGALGAGVQALDFPAELAWVQTGAMWGLGVLIFWARKIEP